MKVKCVRILEGGRRGGRDVSNQPHSSTVEIGRAYVVLGIHCQAEYGPSYAILRQDIYPALAPASLTAEMFEIINPAIPSTWIAVDPYGKGKVIALTPKAWTDPHDFFERKINGDGTLIPAFVREVERMYAEEGLQPPPVRHWRPTQP
jgi:hypothetical protein